MPSDDILFTLVFAVAVTDPAAFTEMKPSIVPSFEIMASEFAN